MKQKNQIALIVRKPEFDLQLAARSHTREALRVLVGIMRLEGCPTDGTGARG